MIWNLLVLTIETIFGCHEIKDLGLPKWYVEMFNGGLMVSMHEDGS